MLKVGQHHSINLGQIAAATSEQAQSRRLLESHKQMRETFRFFERIKEQSDQSRLVKRIKKITFELQIDGAPVHYGIDVRTRAVEPGNLD